MPAAAAGVGHVLTLDARGGGSLAELARAAPSAPPARVSLSPAALAAIVYTSGTTGRSKGAMLTRGNLASNASVLATAWHFDTSDVLLHALPLFHVHGLFAALTTALAAGARVHLLEGFDAAVVLASLAHSTVYMGVPTHYTRLLQQP